jgi:Family of unknown function (DUF5763)
VSGSPARSAAECWRDEINAHVPEGRLIRRTAIVEHEPSASSGILPLPNPSADPNPAVQTPCLYIGPCGQRCNRPARPDGFCAKHKLNPGLSQSEEVSDSALIKRAVAVIGVLIALWPLIAELVREILHHLR